MAVQPTNRAGVVVEPGGAPHPNWVILIKNAGTAVVLLPRRYLSEARMVAESVGHLAKGLLNHLLVTQQGQLLLTLRQLFGRAQAGIKKGLGNDRIDKECSAGRAEQIR